MTDKIEKKIDRIVTNIMSKDYLRGYKDGLKKGRRLAELQDTICALEISHNFKCPIKKKILEKMKT